MFDMSWGEILVIGAVALIVIGPKDLPKALRTLGNMTSKLKRMAGEFQGQFNEAMREAELDEIKKQVAGVNQAASLNPLQTIRDELKSSIEAKPADTTSAATAAAYQGTHVPADIAAAPPAPEIDLPPPDPPPALPAAAEFSPPAAEPEPAKTRVYATEPEPVADEPKAKAS